MSATRVLDGADPASIEEAARLLRGGEVVAFPTETVYGLGADAFSPTAVARVFEVKGRPADNPLIVHVASAGDVALVSDVPDERVARLAAAFWPGPLTLVVPANESVRAGATRGLPTVAVRVPDHDVALALLSAAGPLAAPSANRSGRPSPTRAQDVLADLDGAIPLVLDGGACRIGVESTVLDLVGEPAILRPGAVTAEQIGRVLGKALVGGSDRAERSPGTRYRHYTPRAQVIAVEPGVSEERVETRMREIERAGGRVARVRLAASSEGLAGFARALYAMFRQADDGGATHVVIDLPPPDGLGAAVADRIRRAASEVLA